MTAAHNYEDLHRLLDRLTPEHAEELRTHALRLVDDQATSTREAGGVPVFAGVIENAPPDLAERIGEHVEERFNNPL